MRVWNSQLKIDVYHAAIFSHIRLFPAGAVQSWYNTSKGGLTMNINYIRSGDYFIPDLKLPEETRPIGKWGRMHREYLKEHHPIQFNALALSGNLWTYLTDLNEQAQQRMETLITQMQSAEGITEALKAADPLGWAQCMNNITARAEEIIREELIYNG